MKKVFFHVLLSIILLFSFVPTTFAVSVGDELKQPEEGWTRYDDSHEYIKYIGAGWSVLSNNSYYYQNARHESSSSQINDSVRFVFKGTKLRIISCTYPTYSDSININIDGVNETFSLITSPHNHQILVYEKDGLDDKIHSVEISKLKKGTYSVDLIVDAIDIVGELLSPDTVIPEPTPSPSPEPSATQTPTSEPTVTPTITPSPTPEQPTGDRAILVVTMNTGLEKEFDLLMSEINAFLNWYDSASGSSRYGIDKHDNNKGPFSKRTDYVIFDKILTFEVSEYAGE
ncbi:hypothetical protein D3C75_415200 [compost metagenome]